MHYLGSHRLTINVSSFRITIFFCSGTTMRSRFHIWGLPAPTAHTMTIIRTPNSTTQWQWSRRPWMLWWLLAWARGIVSSSKHISGIIFRRSNPSKNCILSPKKWNVDQEPFITFRGQFPFNPMEDTLVLPQKLNTIFYDYISCVRVIFLCN